MEKEQQKETKRREAEECFNWCFLKVLDALITVGSTRFYLGLKRVRNEEIEREISELENLAAEVLQKMSKANPEDEQITDFLDEMFWIWMRIAELQFKVRMLAKSEGCRETLPIELIELDCDNG